ncbi:hypothetical protein DY240_15730 [Jiangella rhizosphaerae]|uniref:Uncharacterized protein n=1 Tax=Jiangella rhizosphaerae TaxID=2293569 RepID=A0A418KPY5_9ACTN|nr:hypothetical protein DY240_15730 [Jiangella rhizosphaerae]
MVVEQSRKSEELGKEKVQELRAEVERMAAQADELVRDAIADSAEAFPHLERDAHSGRLYWDESKVAKVTSPLGQLLVKYGFSLYASRWDAYGREPTARLKADTGVGHEGQLDAESREALKRYGASLDEWTQARSALSKAERDLSKARAESFWE